MAQLDSYSLAEILLASGALIVFVVAVLQWRFMVSLRRRMAALQLQLTEKGEQASAVQAAAIPADVIGAGRPFVKIELTNPLAVAEQEAAGGAVAGALAPALVKKKVYQDLRKELANELQGRNIAAQVSLMLDGPLS